VESIVRCVRFHGMRSREDLFPAEPTIESFLTDLALNRNVAAATQNQAMHALVFLYTRVLDHAMEGNINAVRADKKINVPVVMTREEVASVISLLDGTAQLVAKLLYGSGLRIMEAVRLRVKDGEPVDHNQHALTAVWTAPTGRERGQLADRMTPSCDPIRSERRPTPCGAWRDCSYRRSWGLKHSQGTPPDRG
jgi:integrase-like protein